MWIKKWSLIVPCLLSKGTACLAVRKKQQVSPLPAKLFIDFSARPARCNSRHLSPAAHFLINCVSAVLSEPQAGRRWPPKWPRLRLLGVPFVDTWADSRGSVLRSHNDQSQWPSSQDQAERRRRDPLMKVSSPLLLFADDVQSARFTPRSSDKQLI